MFISEEDWNEQNTARTRTTVGVPSSTQSLPGKCSFSIYSLNIEIHYILHCPIIT